MAQVVVTPTLPNDVLLSIFAYFVEGDHTSVFDFPKKMAYLSSICQHWRSLINSQNFIRSTLCVVFLDDNFDLPSLVHSLLNGGRISYVVGKRLVVETMQQHAACSVLSNSSLGWAIQDISLNGPTMNHAELAFLSTVLKQGRHSITTATFGSQLRLEDLCQLMPDICSLESIRKLHLSCDQSKYDLVISPEFPTSGLLDAPDIADGLSVLLSFYTREPVFVHTLAALLGRIPLASFIAVGSYESNSRSPLDVILLNKIDLHVEWNSFGHVNFDQVRYVRVTDWNVDRDEHLISTIIAQFPKLVELVIDSATQTEDQFADYFFIRSFKGGAMKHHSRQLLGQNSTLEIFVGRGKSDFNVKRLLFDSFSAVQYDPCVKCNSQILNCSVEAHTIVSLKNMKIMILRS